MGGKSYSATSAGPSGRNVRMVTIELPQAVAEALEREAKSRRKDPAKFMAEWLEDQRDYREAVKVAKRIESGQEKTVPAEVVFRRLGLI